MLRLRTYPVHATDPTGQRTVLVPATAVRSPVGTPKVNVRAVICLDPKIAVLNPSIEVYIIHQRRDTLVKLEHKLLLVMWFCVYKYFVAMTTGQNRCSFVVDCSVGLEDCCVAFVPGYLKAESASPSQDIGRHGFSVLVESGSKEKAAGSAVYMPFYPARFGGHDASVFQYIVDLQSDFWRQGEKVRHLEKLRVAGRTVVIRFLSKDGQFGLYGRS